MASEHQGEGQNGTDQAGQQKLAGTGPEPEPAGSRHHGHDHEPAGGHSHSHDHGPDHDHDHHEHEGEPAGERRHRHRRQHSSNHGTSEPGTSEQGHRTPHHHRHRHRPGATLRSLGWRGVVRRLIGSLMADLTGVRAVPLESGHWFLPQLIGRQARKRKRAYLILITLVAVLLIAAWLI